MFAASNVRVNFASKIKCCFAYAYSLLEVTHSFLILSVRCSNLRFYLFVRQSAFLDVML